MKTYKISDNKLYIDKLIIHDSLIYFVTGKKDVYIISDMDIGCFKQNDKIIFNGFSYFNYKKYMNNKLHLYDFNTVIYDNKIFDKNTYKFPDNPLGFKFIQINEHKINLYHHSGMYLSLFAFTSMGNYCCQVNKYESL